MNNKKGYTLVELIITLAIVGIMIVPIFDAFLESNRVNLRSRRQISAAYLAQNELENIKGMTRGQFNVLDVDSGDGIGIENDAWVYDHTSKISNGGSEFDVNVHIENVTDELSIALKSPTGASQKDERDWHSRITLSDDTSNISVRSNNGNAHSFTSNSREVDLIFNKAAIYSDLVVDTETYKIDHSEFDDPDDTWIRKIYVNIIGYEGLTDEWTINIINNTDYAVDVKPYEDEDGKIKITTGQGSKSNIYIGNAIPILSGDPSTSKEWYNVVITVTHSGTVYEVIESTVGK